MRSNILVWEWGDHIVQAWRSKKYIRKFPKKLLHEDVVDNFNLMMRELGEFMPQTRLIISWDSYIVVQRKVEGRILNELKEEELTPKVVSQLEELLDKVIELNKSHNVSVDLLWPVMETYWKPRWYLRNKSLIIRQIHVFMYMRDILKSFNIMVDENGMVYLVDNVGRKWYFKSVVRKYKNLVLLKLQKSKISSNNAKPSALQPQLLKK